MTQQDRENLDQTADGTLREAWAIAKPEPGEQRGLKEALAARYAGQLEADARRAGVPQQKIERMPVPRLRRIVYSGPRPVSRPAARAPRAAGARTRGSRRTSSSSRSSGTDPGEDDPDDEPSRLCGGCNKPLIGYAAQARYHDDTCRKRAERRRDRREAPRRPVWPSTGIEPTSVLGMLMTDPPHGALTEAVVA